MEFAAKDSSWWVFTLPAFLGSDSILDGYLLLAVFLAFLSAGIVTWFYSPGGAAWQHRMNRAGPTQIPGPRGLPIFGSLFSLSSGLAHRTLGGMAERMNAKQLMAFSIGATPAVVSSDPKIAKEILTSPHFADRPIKQSARSLMFTRAMGFAPNGTYWRLLRRIAASHLFAPRQIGAQECGRLHDCAEMVKGISGDMARDGVVSVRKHLQAASLNNIMGSVFGKRYDAAAECEELRELKEMVREGFELLGAFNWTDFLPWMAYVYDPHRIVNRCEKLVVRVGKLVKGIIEEHRAKEKCSSGSQDFVDILLLLDGEEKLGEDDIIAVLWEMIFRGTDTTALLTEWVMAELILHPDIQSKLRQELDAAVANKSSLTPGDLASLPYLQAVVKEALRVHPPGPLLSWARLSTAEVHLSNGMVVPAATTAMVNMWSITHDPQVWETPLQFKPERFVPSMGGEEFDVRGGDLRLAPFGAGRRVCPGKNLGMITVTLWVAELVRRFEWLEDPKNPVDLTELLKLSCEMKYPVSAVAVNRNVPC